MTVLQHPHQKVLFDFLAGRLSDPELQEIASHLANCATCIEQLQEIPDDPLTHLLRQAVAVNEQTPMPRSIRSHSDS